MSAEKKSGILTSWEQSQYDDIILKAPLQRQHYITYLAQLGEKGKRDIVKRCERIGFNIDFETGQLHYGSNFIPLQLSYDLWFVRHGKTEGNTEPRVYQVRKIPTKLAMKRLFSCMVQFYSGQKYSIDHRSSWVVDDTPVCKRVQLWAPYLFIFMHHSVLLLGTGGLSK